MSGVERIQINKEIYLWALNESQKEEGEIKNRFPKITKWVNGEAHPTFSQLNSLADFLKIPFGYLFLERPPKVDIMEAEFRSINNKLPFMSKNLKDTITAMDLKRNWMSDYRKELGWNRLGVIENFKQHKKNDIKGDALLAKRLLDLDEDWYMQIKDRAEAYSFLREALEMSGIIVMQNGIVGNNTHRKLDINEFRAFMLYDDMAPIIFINNNDSLGGKIFSLIHEYIHILLEQEDVLLGEDIFEQKKSEGYINRITSEFLMPTKHVRFNWNQDKDVFEQINHLSSMFNVSETALAIKLKELELIDKPVLDTVIDEGIKNFESKNRRSGKSGGNFYNTFNTRISPTFTKAVIRSVEARDLGYSHAFRLLGGIKGRTYDEIKVRLLPKKNMNLILKKV